jgi:hypothetical protein
MMIENCQSTTKTIQAELNASRNAVSAGTRTSNSDFFTYQENFGWSKVRTAT